ncbi:MAG: hypothetical protein ACKO3P_20645, partial [Planctomycetaceae bacterium]
GEAVIADLVSHANAQYLANELVTGLRVRRSRDPVVLKLATELGLLGQEPAGPSPVPTNPARNSLPSAPSERAPRQRAGFISWLETLSDSQFDLLRAAFPLSFSSVPASGPVPQRARTLLEWAEGPRGPGLAPLIQLARTLWPQILTGGVPDAAAARADDWAVVVLNLKSEGGRSAEGDSPASAKPRTETRENTQAWEQAAAALRALLQAPASAAGPAPSSAAIHGALDWLAWLRERVPWAPPTAILPLTAGGLLIERETEDEAGHLTTAELSLPNDEAAEFTLFRDHHVVETREVSREHARQFKVFTA